MPCCLHMASSSFCAEKLPRVRFGVSEQPHGAGRGPRAALRGYAGWPRPHRCGLYGIWFTAGSGSPASTISCKNAIGEWAIRFDGQTTSGSEVLTVATLCAAHEIAVGAGNGHRHP